jgi:hypothetical protein
MTHSFSTLVCAANMYSACSSEFDLEAEAEALGGVYPGVLVVVRLIGGRLVV